MNEEKLSAEIKACAAIVVGEGTYHVIVEPDGDGGSGTTIRGEGNKPGMLKAAYTMLVAYVNACDGMTFEDAMEQMQWMKRLGDEACDTRILKSIVPKGEEI